MKRRNVLHILAWFGLTFGGGTALVACPLDPAKTPPCDPRHPDDTLGCWSWRRGLEAGTEAGPDGGSDAR